MKLEGIDRVLRAPSVAPPFPPLFLSRRRSPAQFLLTCAIPMSSYHHIEGAGEPHDSRSGVWQGYAQTLMAGVQCESIWRCLQRQCCLVRAHDCSFMPYLVLSSRDYPEGEVDSFLTPSILMTHTDSKAKLLCTKANC